MMNLAAVFVRRASLEISVVKDVPTESSNGNGMKNVFQTLRLRDGRREFVQPFQSQK